MNVLMLSTDRKVFEVESDVASRMISYGRECSALHIIVFAKKELGLEPKQIGENVHLYPTQSHMKFLYLADAVRIAKEIDTVDIVTTQDPFETGMAGIRISDEKEVRLQVQVHTDFLSPYFKISLVNRIRSLFAPRILAKADCIRVVSKRILESLPARLQSKASVLPVFVSSEERSASFSLREKYPQFSFIVVMVSRLEREKNIPLALSTFKEFAAEHPGSGLIIVGDGKERAALEKEALELGVARSVVFARWQDDLTSYYQGADLFLNTSSYEGYGRTLLEAALAGSPMVTTDVGIVGDVLTGESVRVCQVGDRACLKAQLTDVIEHRDELSQSAEEFARVLRSSLPSVRTHAQAFAENLRNCGNSAKRA